jgi:hypothetical protein
MRVFVISAEARDIVKIHLINLSRIFILPLRGAIPHHQLNTKGVGRYEESNFGNTIATMEGD